MSQKPLTAFYLHQYLAQFLDKLSAYSGIRSRIDHSSIMVYYSGELKIGEKKNFEVVVINIWLQRAYNSWDKPDTNSYLLTVFSPTLTLTRTDKSVRILGGNRFISVMGLRLATEAEYKSQINLKNANQFYNIRSEDNLRSLIEKYIWYAKFYECLPIFSMPNF